MKNSSYITFEDCRFDQNSASSYGGAIYSDEDNNYITFAGTSFTNNEALVGYGGAYYTFSNQQNFVFCNSKTYKSITVLETVHPVQDPLGKYLIYTANVNVPNAEAYVIVFDKRTYMTNEFIIYESPAKVGLEIQMIYYFYHLKFLLIYRKRCCLISLLLELGRGWLLRH
jgi:predicted outer membrane repeat protein